MRFILL